MFNMQRTKIINAPLTRTMMHRIQFGALVCVTVGAVAAAGYGILQAYPEARVSVIAGFALLLLIPGRVQQFYWKGFFKAQKLQLKGLHRDALEEFQRFLETLRLRPGLRHLIWLSQWSYTRDVEVMTLNNMGCSAMSLRSMKQAEAYLKSAAELDPDSPLPYYNLAVLYYGLGNDGHGAANLVRAETLGYRKASIRELTRMTKAPRAGKGGGKAAPQALAHNTQGQPQ
jgi:tetratricopeptide (TPR) repeat protein